jgi:hypothetical protein
MCYPAIDAVRTFHLVGGRRKGLCVAETNEETAIRLVRDRVSANGGEVLEASAVQKSKDAYLVYVTIDAEMASRVAVVTLEEISNSKS